MIIVTGGIACGKSVFLDKAKELGYNCIDADDWFHNEMSNESPIRILARIMLKTVDLKTVAFQHEYWNDFISVIDYSFQLWVQSQRNNFDIVVIPDFFSRNKNMLFDEEVLTIERLNNFEAAIERDAHRSEELTAKIYQAQMNSEERMSFADHVIYNNGTKEEFEKECEEWLQLHLQGHLIQSMKDTNT